MPTSYEPQSTDDLRALLLGYLDFYRDVISAKVRDLSADQLRTSRLPSGWTPAGLVNHLTYAEWRWMQWGFLAEQVTDPWGDHVGEGWVTPDAVGDDLLAPLREVGARTRKIVEAHELSDYGRVGGRFPEGTTPPQLHWILLHLIQEYARHAGHLDIARELEDGAVGEQG